MATRGRKSAASLAVAAATIDRRLQPPADLTGRQREVWVTTVGARPADMFGVEHAPLLRQYCEHVVTAESLSAAISKLLAGEPDKTATQQVERLVRMRSREDSAVIALARSMRLTPRSVYDAQKASVASKQAAAPGARKPWQAEPLAH